MPETQPVRCAIYTRKSTEEGLEQEFNSLQAQRESAEACVLSHRQAGWTVVPYAYEDGGFSGANLDRPGLKRLLADIEAGKVDCVLVYKLDRLSRSLLDFARLMELFDSRGVSFVSVTQDFNTTTSLGRLTLNLLTSFAEFERALISERTRDKLSAARRKGKWIGGCPVLGYDVHPNGGRLVINPEEAGAVRRIFAMALEAGSLEATLREITAAGLTTKVWTSKRGMHHRGRSFSRQSLRALLANTVYIGQVSYKGTVYPGEHEAIVDGATWEQVNARLQSNAEHQQGRRHQKQQALLRGLLYCRRCAAAMAATFTLRHGRRYVYYACPAARLRGGRACSQRPVAAVDLEESVKRELRSILGPDLSAPVIHGSVERVRYDSGRRNVNIQLRAGSCIEYRLPAPNRPGVARAAAEPCGRVPRVSRLMALAIQFEGKLRDGYAATHRELAQAGRISRARLSQIMELANLAPALQERVLFLPKTISGPDRILERDLRPIARVLDWQRQSELFESLVTKALPGTAR